VFRNVVVVPPAPADVSQRAHFFSIRSARVNWQLICVVRISQRDFGDAFKLPLILPRVNYIRKAGGINRKLLLSFGLRRVISRERGLVRFLSNEPL
jgi:hypothetical protein